MGRTRGSGVVGRTGRLVRTVAHLHPAQIAFRPVHVVRTRLLGNVPPLARLVAGHESARPGARILALNMPLERSLPGLAPELERAELALDGWLELVGRKLRLHPPETDFGAPEDPKLVRYQLGYLAIVRSLALAARTADFPRSHEAARLAIAHAREFVTRIPPGRGDAWEPYVVATRLLNLVVARELLLPIATAEERAFLDGPLLASLAQHARWMLATLELHLLGNHLFTDAAALFVAGCAVDAPGAERWRSVGHALLARSLATDVLPDGGHAERSPMYAALYLDQLELVLAAARAAGKDAPAGAREAAASMARQLVAIAHPDGEIPLLGDSVFDEAPPPGDVAAPFGLGADSLRRRLYGPLGDAIALDEERRDFPATGLLAIRRGDEHLVLDAGPLGTRDQPGHAHADALSFELSHRGRRLIVDGGAGHYDADEIRAYFRGPFAHSGVSVDGEGPDELWSAFRAGGRSRVSPVHAVACGRMHVLRASVRASGGWRTERLVFYAPGELLAVFDRVQRAREGAEVLSHVLLAPDVALQLGGSACELQPSDGPSLSIVRLLGGEWRGHRGEERPRRGWTSRHFGAFDPAWALELPAIPLGPGWGTGWALLLDRAAVAVPEPGGARLAAGGAEVRVTVDRRGMRWEELRAG